MSVELLGGEYYLTIANFKLGEILPYVPTDLLELPNGMTAKCCSMRLLQFKRSIVCVDCGLVGVFFALESNNGYRYRRTKGVKILNPNANFHLNMYAMNWRNKPVLMTRDHIIAKVNGGPDTLENSQTMCTKCNSEKGADIREKTT